MADDMTRRLAELKDRMRSGRCKAAEQVEMRDRLVQMQYRLRAIELQLEEANEEVKKLAGSSLSGLVYSLMGSKGERLERARQAHQELEKQYDKCRREVEELDRQVGRMDSQVHDDRTSAEEFERLLAEKQEQIAERDDNRNAELSRLCEADDAAQADVKCVERAVKAGTEALRDLNEEIETVSTLGRCRVIEASRMLKGVMAATRGKTSDQCAERVKQSIGRFRLALNEVLKRCSSDAGPEMLEINAWLERVGEAIAGSWLSREARGEESADHVSQRLQMANMVVEKTLNAVRERARAAEDARRSYVESA